MPKRVVQHATSASRRTKRVAKPSTPWRRGRSTEVPAEILAANPGKRPRWVRKGKEGDRARVDSKLSEDYVRPIIPKGLEGNKSVAGTYDRKDCTLMMLPQERFEAREYDIQERSEAHLTRKQKERADLAKSKGYEVLEDSVSTGGDDE